MVYFLFPFIYKQKLKHTEVMAQGHTTVSRAKPEPVWLWNLHFNHFSLLRGCENLDKAWKLLYSVCGTQKPLKKCQSLFLGPRFTCLISLSHSDATSAFPFFALEMFPRWEERLRIPWELALLGSGHAVGNSKDLCKVSSVLDLTCSLTTQAEFIGSEVIAFACCLA